MWCVACQVDAPALAVPEEPGVVRCAFCGGELAGRRDQQNEPPIVELQGTVGKRLSDNQLASAPDELVAAVPLLAFVPPPTVDDWKADAELRQVERLVAVVRQTQERADPMRIADCGLPITDLAGATRPQSSIPTPHSSPTGLAAWACLTLGLMAFVCGGVLVGWSLVADRGDLWSLGLPLTLGGQVSLVLGLLLQLDGLSQSTQRTAQTLTDLDGRLGELREVTALVSATHSAPAHSFYAHLTAGASPQILLADLKGQLDLLAQQMARQRKAA